MVLAHGVVHMTPNGAWVSDLDAAALRAAVRPC
jgi:hypothetical protein